MPEQRLSRRSRRTAQPWSLPGELHSAGAHAISVASRLLVHDWTVMAGRAGVAGGMAAGKQGVTRATFGDYVVGNVSDPAKPNAVVVAGAATFANTKPLALIAGPCALESRSHALEMAAALKEIAARLGIGLVYKTSFDKANRT